MSNSRRAFSLALLIAVLALFVGCGNAPSPVSSEVGYPHPQLSSIAPATVTSGGTDTTITVQGSGFNAITVVTANSTNLPTTFVNSSQITAVIPAKMLFSSGVLQIGVFTAPPGGGSSGPILFTVVDEGQVSATGHPLVAQYALTTPREAAVTVQFGLDTTYAQRTSAQPTPSGGGEAVLLVAGMRPSTTYHLRAVAQFPDGAEYDGPDQTFTTGDISSMTFTNTQVTLTGTGQPAPGVEFINAIKWSAGDTSVGMLVTDIAGNVIWYYVLPPSYFPFPFKLLPNGHILVIQADPSFAGGSSSLVEIDLAGNLVRQLDIPTLSQRVAAKGFSLPYLGNFHHDFAALPNGHIIALVNRQATVTRTTGPATIVGDALVDLDENWEPVWVWDSTKHLDVNRVVLDPTDWTHGNAVVYTPDDGNLLFSMRNQSWIIKVDYKDGNGTGDVLWRSGYQGDFAIAGNNPADWHYGQHDPTIVGTASAGNFLLGVYDNGNNRVMDSSGTLCGESGTPPCYTRGVIYAMNEIDKVASVAWEDNFSPIYTSFIGSIQALPNDDVEIDLGAYSLNPDAAQVREVTQTNPPQLVWQMDTNHIVYRGLRMPSLYPGVQW